MCLQFLSYFMSVALSEECRGGENYCLFIYAYIKDHRNLCKPKKVEAQESLSLANLLSVQFACSTLCYNINGMPDTVFNDYYILLNSFTMCNSLRL
jgi:hypothetical protein